MPLGQVTAAFHCYPVLKACLCIDLFLNQLSYNIVMSPQKVASTGPSYLLKRDTEFRVVDANLRVTLEGLLLEKSATILL